MESERLQEQRDVLAARGHALEAELSRAAAAGRVEAIAIRKLGLVRPDDATYLSLLRAKE
ncbi:MAG TPA: hypothetical protein VK915_02950 [Gaiellaceae bacterium]|nr:hypothetical protein [Gaiellaceae bacterium]